MIWTVDFISLVYLLCSFDILETSGSNFTITNFLVYFPVNDKPWNAFIFSDIFKGNIAR